MAEIRKDPIVGRWVIMAPDRAQRPQDFTRLEPAPAGGVCPFCQGNEAHTPHEILACRDLDMSADGRGWRVRVVPNKFPALQLEGTHCDRGDGIYDSMGGLGAHEVIIECPHHESSMARLSVDNIREILWVYRDRLVDLKRDPRLVHGLIFKNAGALAGASLDHSHSQLIVMPVVPTAVREEMRGALELYNSRGCCIYCDMIQQELATGSRIVMDTPNFVVFCPFASRFPFETWVLPKQHSSHFENIPRHVVEEMGIALKTVLRKLELALDNPPYNYIIHTAPFDTKELPHYHWHLEIIPRLTQIAGFEWGSGYYINPVLPEQAGALLREAKVATSAGGSY